MNQPYQNVQPENKFFKLSNFFLCAQYKAANNTRKCDETSYISWPVQIMPPLLMPTKNNAIRHMI